MVAFTADAWFGFGVVVAGLLLFTLAGQVEMRINRRKRDKARAQARDEWRIPARTPGPRSGTRRRSL